MQKITKKQWKEHKDAKDTVGGQCLFCRFFAPNTEWLYVLLYSGLWQNTG